ncbi:3'5'-cyclic nucleotide phosphodiesterase [Dictyocaulus viviparus]|uniref:Phosphodiesterase n=1 Tax=Dictyocaulus viviparus TaxID=29172 RepID=A0A0D8XJ45_DICVI|nr:3'5'-cyclic nucleotide phosphodiesterase [Dictyocaulus viviparus]
MYRDVSLKSIRSQVGMVEAPISEVLSLLRDAAGQVEGETAQLVKDAVKVLSSHELYAPSITRFRNNDRIATQYYDGLIRLHHPPRHRKRSIVDAFRDKKGLCGERRRVSADVKNALENDHDWSFDILMLEKLTDNHALSQIGLKIFERWKVADSLGCNEDILERWLCTIEAHYHAGNAYHNATHAADVLQATSYFLDSPSVAAHVSENHAIAALIAATIHDLDHPGRGNAFLINTRQSLAVLYNDHSVLENHHVALAFQLTLQQSNNVIVFIVRRMKTSQLILHGNLSREEFTTMRHSIVEMVLATDISRHFEYLVRFNKMNIVDVAEETKDGNSMTICNMLVKCADISNPTREWSLCQKWAYRIVEEYFDQTREEREKGLPITMEVFDRLTCNVPLTQCGFIDMFVREAFADFTGFANLDHLSIQLERNYDQWKSQTSSWIPANNMALHS